MWTLWRWSKAKDSWQFETYCNAEGIKRMVMRNARRRNPTGTLFRWKEGEEPPTRKHFKRMVKH